jgi:hypothetical protein
MTLNRFKIEISKAGYTISPHPCGFNSYFVNAPKSLILDNVRGGAYRIFMGRGAIPANHPATASVALQQIDAESPWFQYHGPTEKTDALQCCWDWLCKIGFPFLDNPFCRPLHEWTSEYKILIRDRGVIIPIPRARILP